MGAQASAVGLEKPFAGTPPAMSEGGNAPIEASKSTLSFPAFRSEEWIKAEFDRLQVPSMVLEGVDLSPAYMTSFPTVGLFPGKVAQVRQQIKTALFRQALFKVQNTEVTYLDECRDMRVLQRITLQTGSSLLGRAVDLRNPSDVKLLHEELWAVDRCGHSAEYNVRYYKEGGDGFSTLVLPRSLPDLWRSFRYYYWDGE